MKKLITILLLIISIKPIIAQEGEDVGWVARFGIAGGVNPSYFFPNLEPINTEIKKMGLSELSNSGMFLWGGGGYAYIMLVDNLRLGGIGIGGSTSTKGTKLGLNKEVGYNFGIGGVTVEYTLPFVQYVAVSIGGIVGVGSQSIEIYQSSSDYTWNNIWSKVNTTGTVMHSDVNYEVTNTFFTIIPTVNLDIPISRFIALRFGGGYIFNFNSDWKVNNGINISGVSTELTKNNFFIQTGIYFGFFAF